QGGTPGVFANSGQSLPDALSNAVALGDVDRDGDLDAVTASVNSGNHLWINQGGAQGGTEGVFQDSGQSLGPNNNRHVALADVDVDGDPDLFVSRNGPNTVWLNQGGIQGGTAGQFQDSGQSLGNLFSMATALGDIDGDNDPDAVVSNFGGPNQVWLNEGLSGLETMYQVRDTVMAPTPQGQHYITLFYTHNPEILSLLLADPALFDEAYDGLVLWLPNLESLVDDTRGDPTISAEQVQAVDDFLTNLSAVASPTLQQVIADERADLPPPEDFIGLTMSQAEQVVLGGGPMAYLPVVVKATGSHAVIIPAGPISVTPAGGKCVLYCLLTGDCD
ncbi:MAG: VCBS repeat-containing protein, partial [Chloroflexi bacterium]|nr:VCBS repeat-containing protein [Chloroflexota bacterium]MCI0726931.1 VCBS repeat-containing protein [Chloroflexota bacterium]